jgi:DNA-directed RNA polymerase subunit alpha
VRDGDIVTDPAVTVGNPDHLIATLTSDVDFHMEMTARKGRGYATGSDNRTAEQELGVIPVDSIFSPVLRVRYRTEYMRVGRRTNYDRLIMEVWTNGMVTPEDALVEAGLILRKHMNPFVMYHDLGDQLITPTERPVEAPASEGSALQELLDKPVSILNLSVRASNCLEAAKIATLRELACQTEADLLRFRSFGKTSLHEVQRKLTDVGMSLGLKIDENGQIIGTSEPQAPEETTETPDTEVPEASDDPSVPANTGPMEAFTMGD